MLGQDQNLYSAACLQALPLSKLLGVTPNRISNRGAWAHEMLSVWEEHGAWRVDTPGVITAVQHASLFDVVT